MNQYAEDYERYAEPGPGTDRDFAAYMAQRHLAQLASSIGLPHGGQVSVPTVVRDPWQAVPLERAHDGGPFVHAPPDPLGVYRPYYSGQMDPGDVE